MSDTVKALGDAVCGGNGRALRRIEFWVQGVAATAGSKVAFRHSKTGRVIVKDMCKRGPSWRADVRAAAMQKMSGELMSGPIRLDVVFNLPRPKWHYSAKGLLKPNAPKHHTTTPDCLKLVRAMEDALTHVVWTDDKLIVEQGARKDYAVGPPGAYVVIQELC